MTDSDSSIDFLPSAGKEADRINYQLASLLTDEEDDDLLLQRSRGSAADEISSVSSNSNLFLSEASSSSHPHSSSDSESQSVSLSISSHELSLGERQRNRVSSKTACNDRKCKPSSANYFSGGGQASQSSDDEEEYERFLERMKGASHQQHRDTAHYADDNDSLDDFIVDDDASLSGESESEERLFYIKTTNHLKERSASITGCTSSESISSEDSSDLDISKLALSDSTPPSLSGTKEGSSSIFLHDSISDEVFLTPPNKQTARAALISDSDDSFDELLKEGIQNRKQATPGHSDGASQRSGEPISVKSPKTSFDQELPSLDLSESDEDVLLIKEPIKTPARRLVTPTITAQSHPNRPLTVRGVSSNYTPATDRTGVKLKQRGDQVKTEPRLRRTESSFLASLSTHFDENQQRHHDAVKYVREFKRYKGELVKHLKAFYNQNIFSNKLNDVDVSFNKRLLKTAGLCKYLKTSGSHTRRASVELSEKVCDTAERVRDTLIHEMCHAAVWIVDGVEDGHGRYWQFWSKKAELTCKELPPIRRCHSYDITTKFVYECIKCKYQIGRHSKSLDVDKKVCGRCRGTFQLLTRTSKGQMTPVASTPNKFALFVKDNYGRIRKDTTSHREAMQQLSENFSLQLTV